MSNKRGAFQIWGCEFIESVQEEGYRCISEVAYTIDNTTKTRALFEINKGVGIENSEIEVNTKIPEGNRRVHFINMMYIADGPSDIPAFSVVRKNGGATFAVYPKGNVEAMKQVEGLRKDGRIDMYAEADYRENTTAEMWICEKIKELADKIVQEEKEKIRRVTGGSTPRHLTD